ncbi:MAG: Drug resistance transporter, EmrB/QacA subfamily [Acidimicrobiaceae bacterium]|nr:Drug resistance transporter, EmrB/QacA subfamily [Acidimicrobiaceae bacterium]
MPTTLHRRRWWVLGVLCLVVLIVVIDNTIVNVALPVLSKDLHASNSSLQWIVDAYSLPFAALLLAGGGLSDRLGRKRVMHAGLGAFGAFSLMAAFSTSVATLLVARSLMGAAAAFIFPATLSTVTITFDDLNERAKAFGLWGAAAGVAIAIGPVVGGALLVHFWYGSIFLINAPLVVIVIVASAFVVPESKSPRRRPLDLGGLILGTTGVATLTLAIIEGPAWGWRSGTTLSIFLLALLSLASFVLYEMRRQGPLLDVRIFANRSFSAGAGAIAINYFCLLGFIFLITQYFQLIRGYSALSAGVHTLPFAAVAMVATPLSAVAALKFGARNVVSAGLMILAGALAWGDVVGAHAAYFGPVVALMVTLALGFSLVNAPSTAALMSTLAPEQIGAGAAVNETTRELAGTMGVAVIGSVFSSLFGPAVRRALRPYLSHGLSSAQLRHAASSTHAAQLTVAHFPLALQRGLNAQVTNAFMDGLHRGCLVGAVVAALAAVLVFTRLPQNRETHECAPVVRV